MYTYNCLTYQMFTIQYYYAGKGTNTKTRDIDSDSDSDSGVIVAIVVSVLVASGIVVDMSLLFIRILLQKR